MENILSTTNLTKVYGDRAVVDRVALELFGGEIFGLFGPNGSGASTIIRRSSGLTKPSMGRIIMRNNGESINVLEEPVMTRKHCAILTETPSVYERMELFNYLKFYGKLSALPEKNISQKVLEVVSIVGMEDHLYRPLRQMSMGERQRVEIARVLLKDSPVLFLDEPFNGIDITTRREIRDYLRNNWLNDKRCIFYTSHNLLESEHFVDRFAFIHRGRLLTTGDKKELRKKFKVKKFVIYLMDLFTAQQGLSFLVKNDQIEAGEVVNNLIYVTLKTKEEVDDVIRTLVNNGISFHEIHPVDNIEDMFIELLNEIERKEGFS